MIVQKELSRQQTHSVHLEAGLLFQFILSEVLKASKEAQKLCWKQRNLTAADFNRFITPMNQLSGSQKEYMRIFTWNPSEGILAKLKKYCAYFAELSSSNDKRGQNLHRQANQSWLLCMQCFDRLKETHTKNLAPIEFKRLCTSLTKLKVSIHKLEQFTAASISAFKHDENVIFFLIRHVDQFDEAFGKGFVKTMLQNFFPQGRAELSKFLMQRYGLRGFDNLFPEIANSVELL